MEEAWDRLWVNARIATMRPEMQGPYGMIEEGAIASRDGKIAWVGKLDDLPVHQANRVKHPEWEDLDGRLITPGLIDCHTHLVYGGDRAREFEQRLNGATYQQIAAQGGGILSTVRQTRAADEHSLRLAALSRLDALRAEGVTTIEIKSGYGLDRANEIKSLRVARSLAKGRPVTIRTTLLAAHTVPPEFAGRADDYITEIIDHILPAVAAENLADAIDGFCETVAFTPDQIARLFAAAQRYRLPVKLHAEQLSDSGGAALAARFGALSADHLEHLSDSGIEAMKKAGTVAVMLPAAFYFLRETKLPPIEKLRAAGIPIAVATDCNPGTAPIASLRTAMNMACVLFGLSPAEVLAGVTRNAARALGLHDRLGTLKAGKQADFLIWPTGEPARLCYEIGTMMKPLVIQNGEEPLS